MAGGETLIQESANLDFVTKAPTLVAGKSNSPLVTISQLEDTCGRFHNDGLAVLSHPLPLGGSQVDKGLHWRFRVAAAAAVAAAIAAVVGKRITMCRVFSLRCVSVSLPFYFPISLPLHLRLEVESLRTLSSSRASSARQTRRLSLALRMVDPSSIRIHHVLFHHVMCLLDTSLYSFIKFLLSSSFFSPKHSFLLRPS